MSTVKATFVADTSGFNGPVEKMVRSSQSAARRIAQSYTTELANVEHRLSQVLPDTVTAHDLRARRMMLLRQKFAREAGGFDPSGVTQTIGGGFLGRLAGAGSGMSQMIHSLRASFDSIVTGANPVRVAMQQLPQMAQALWLAGVGLKTTFLALGSGLLATLPIIADFKIALDTARLNKAAKESGLNADILNANTRAEVLRQLFENSSLLGEDKQKALSKAIREAKTDADTREAVAAGRDALLAIYHSPEQMKAGETLDRITERASLEAISDPFAKRRMEERLRFEKTRAEITAAGTADPRNEFQQRVIAAQYANRLQNEEVLRQIDLDEAQSRMKLHQRGLALNAQQQHGAYISFGGNPLLDVNKQQLAKLDVVAQTLKKIHDTGGLGRRGVTF
jgi:hypothetical protein